MIERLITAKRRSACRMALLVASTQASLLIADPALVFAEPTPSGGAAPATNPAPATPAAPAAPAAAPAAPATPSAPAAPAAKPQDGAAAGGGGASAEPTPPSTPPGAKPLPPIPVKTAKPKVKRAPPPPSQPVRAPAAPRAPAPAAPAPRATEPATPAPVAGSTVEFQQGGNPQPGAGVTTTTEVASRNVTTSDVATALGDVPGVSVYAAGGVSGLPTVDGFADDRLRIKVDGMDTISSCPNHMNSPLSYIAPSQIGSAQVWTGVTPVSISGDAIGGTIIVNSAAPLFAAPGQALVTKGSAGAFYRSNGDGWGSTLSGTAATEHYSASYDGSYATSSNYLAGGNFVKFPLVSNITKVLPNDDVGSTAYEATNHLATLAYTNKDQLIELKTNYQYIPYEMYPNQRMDMLSNSQIGLNLHYSGKFDWGNADTRVYWQGVDHYMNFGEDKNLWYGNVRGIAPFPVAYYPALGMPMYTKSDTLGNSSKVDINITGIDVARVGYDLQFYRLDDWWPPSPDCGVGICRGGMAPLTFWNINDGQRDRYSPFLEWERKWSPETNTTLGIRYELITEDTGSVQGYNFASLWPPLSPMRTMYETSSVGTRAAFNAMDRARDFDNIDLSGLVRYTPNVRIDTELGLSRTARAPNLYELYDWSRHPMALEMNNFVGDGNGYLGNPFLKPEIANRATASLDWHTRDRETAIRFSPYYSYVEDYIDAVQWNRTTNLPASPLEINQYVFLKYMNEDARLYGFDLSTKAPLAKTSFGDLSAAGMISYVNGRDISLHTGLYNIMPLNGKLALIHKLGGWRGTAEFVGVSAKDEISDQRNEVRTPGYGLFNLRGSYVWENFHFNFGVENVLNQLYYLPLGGAYVGEGATMSLNNEAGNVKCNPSVPPGNPCAGVSGTQTGWGTTVAGPGRTFFIGVKVDL